MKYKVVVFGTKQSTAHIINKFKNDSEPDFEIDEAHKEHLKSLGLWEEDTYDGSEFIDKL